MSVNVTEIGFDSTGSGHVLDEEVLEPKMSLTGARPIFNLASNGHRYVDIAHAVQGSFGPAQLALDLLQIPTRF